MELTFLGGASEVGASCTLMHIVGHRLLIDGGMRPAAREGQSRLPDLTLLETAPPEALLITHAHIDHTGALPLIASLYPHIPIYATESTRVLTEILLRDSVKIMEQEGLKPDGETPLYSAEQVDLLLARIRPVGFHQPFAPIPSAPEVTVQYLPAGHILGAAMLYFETPEGTLLHTGDISVTDQRTIKGLDIQKLLQADLMICEGTYGSRSHTNRKEEERKLAETVQAVLARGGRVLLPAFAVGRSQEIVLILKSYRASGYVSPVPIYLDGMVRSMCTAYQMQSHDLHPSLQRYLTNARRPLFADPDLHIFAVRSFERTMLTQRKDPMIVISSSGMLTGGASPLYAATMAAREQDAIIFSGYQDEESPGAALLKAQQGETVRVGDQRFSLTCQVARYNLSGHADGEQIVHAVTKVAPKRLILVHGDTLALEALAQRFPKIPVDIPVVGTTLSLQALTRSKTTTQTQQISQGRRPPAPTGVAPARSIDETPPTIEDLWKVACEKGPTRPWTSVELGQHYYGSAYHPGLRPQVEQVLKSAAAYFKQGRVGAQPTYLPRPSDHVEQLRPVAMVTPGEIVLVQGGKAQPQIALVLSAPQDGAVSLVADQWKGATRPMNVIQLLPGIHRADLLTAAPEEAKHHLQTWRKQVEGEWIDLLAWWHRCQGRPFTFASLCESQTSDDQRLAWGLELLVHGEGLFRRDGTRWTPLDEQRVRTNAGFVHHLALLLAGAGAGVQYGEKHGVLTGRSNWRLFEVRWGEDEQSGERTGIRGAALRLAPR